MMMRVTTTAYRSHAPLQRGRPTAGTRLLLPKAPFASKETHHSVRNDCVIISRGDTALARVCDGMVVQT